MSVDHKDSVGDQTSTTGTTDFVIDGVALTGCVSFATALTDGATYNYRAQDAANGEWEVGQGVWTAGTSTLTRATVFRSSNGGSKTAFSAGAKAIGIVAVATDFTSGATLATLLHAATAKTTLVDADEVNGTNSANSFSLIRTVWSDVWTYIKSKADAVYAIKGAITGSALTQATGKLLGRSTASTGAIEEITVGSGLSLSAGTLSVSGGSGATLSANTFTDKQTITQATTNTGVLYSTGYSLTGSSTASMLDFSGTLNTSGSPDVIAVRITDTARGASTKFLNLYGGAAGATSKFSVSNSGDVVAAGALTVSGAVVFSQNLQVASGYVNAGDHIYVGNFGVAIGNASGVLVVDNGATSTLRNIKAGTYAVGITAKTADYTVTLYDGANTFDCTGGARTATLPALSTTVAGQIYIAKKIDASGNAMNVDANASETIDGSSSAQTTSTQWGTVRVMVNADKSGWITW